MKKMLSVTALTHSASDRQRGRFVRSFWRLLIDAKGGIFCFHILSHCARPIFFYDPVVIDLICYRRKASSQVNENNMTGWLRKIWTGETAMGVISIFLERCNLKYVLDYLLCICASMHIQTHFMLLPMYEIFF